MIDGTGKDITTTFNTSSVFESNLVHHTADTLGLTLSFGQVSHNCGKLLQDLTIYLQKCPSYCTTCTDGGILKQLNSDECLSTCPNGQTISPNGTHCLACTSPCIWCVGTVTNCIKCGAITSTSGGTTTTTNYYLYDSDLSNSNAGGSCL